MHFLLWSTRCIGSSSIVTYQYKCIIGTGDSICHIRDRNSKLCHGWLYLLLPRNEAGSRKKCLVWRSFFILFIVRHYCQFDPVLTVFCFSKSIPGTSVPCKKFKIYKQLLGATFQKYAWVRNLIINCLRRLPETLRPFLSKLPKESTCPSRNRNIRSFMTWRQTAP